MKLQEIKEAKHVSQSTVLYGTAMLDDGSIMVTAPFSSEKEAEQYILWEAKEYGLREDEHAEVIMLEPPGW